MSLSPTSTKQAWSLLILLSILWGSSFILMKRALIVLSPLELAAMRMFIASVCLLPFLPAALRRINKEDVLWIAGVGLLGNGIPAFLFATGQTHIPSSLAGLINALSPMFSVTVGAIFFKTKFGRNQFFGIGLGFISTALLALLPRGNNSLQFSLDYYALLPMLATVMYGFSINILKNKLSHGRPEAVSALALSFVGFPYGIFLLLQGVFPRVIAQPLGFQTLGVMFILSAIGTAFAVVMFNRLIQMSSAAFASSVTYLIPLVALSWGLLDGEVLSAWHSVIIVLIIVSVYLVNSPQKQSLHIQK